MSHDSAPALPTVMRFRWGRQSLGIPPAATGVRRILSQNLSDHAPMHVGQPKIASAVAEGQTLMIDSQ